MPPESRLCRDAFSEVDYAEHSGQTAVLSSNIRGWELPAERKGYAVVVLAMKGEKNISEFSDVFWKNGTFFHSQKRT